MVNDSYPDRVQTWVADVSNTSGNSITFTVRASCLVPYVHQQDGPIQIVGRPGG